MSNRETITVTKLDETFLHIAALPYICSEMSEYFRFKVPGCHFMPAYRAKMWDGFKRLFNRKNNTLYVGLYQHLKKFAADHEYTLVCDFRQTKPQLTYNGGEQFYASLKLANGVIARDYQVASLVHCLNEKRAILDSSTASGKSLVIYALAQFIKQKTLIVVPTVDLVHQMEGDFLEYSNGETKVHKIFEGQLHDSGELIYVSTYQSIYKNPKSYFDKFNVLIGDECHSFKAESLTAIAEKMTKAHYKIGTTGTLDGAKMHQFILEGLFGPVYKATTTKELIEKKYISELKIKCPVIKYSDDERKEVKKLKYQDEIKYILSHKKRTEFIVNLALSRSKNTLVLFQHVTKNPHGKNLYDLAKRKLEKTGNTQRKIFLIYGGTAKEIRQAVRGIVEKETNAIIFASSQIYSTGINIRNLHNIIFAHPSKSRIRVLQSIGRSLRKYENKTATLFDIVDDLSWKKHMNYALKHFMLRVEIYDSEQLPYKIMPITL